MRDTKTPIERIFAEEAKREPTADERRVLLEKPRKKRSASIRKSKKPTPRPG